METVQDLQPLSISDYLGILRRRKLSMMVPIFLILVAAIALAFLLPPVYRSEATILVQREEVPEDLVQSTVTGLAGERVQQIAQRLLTNKNVWDIAERLDLWPGDRTLENRQDIIDRMKEGISVEMVDVETALPGSTRQAIMTVAFNIAFEADSPETARTVARELSDVFLEQNRQMRNTQVSEVARFVAEESEKLAQQISELESQLATFKQDNRNFLPELADVNMRLLEQAQAKLERTEETIRSLQLQRDALQSQLRVTDPYAPLIAGRTGLELLGPVEKLQQLRAEYIAASARYSVDHPDLVKLRREISALEGQLGVSGGDGQQFAQLDDLRRRLASAESRYSSDHPDVVSLRSAVASLEGQIHERTSQRSITSMSRLTQAPSNPQYVALQSQLDGVVTTLQAEIANREMTNAKLIELEERLFQTPAVERDQASLLRDYNNAVLRYKEVKDKQLQARLAEQLEIENKGERFELIDPATLPSMPERPNRPGIVLLGAFLAFTSGIGSASLAEYFDRAVRGVRAVTAIMLVPPLAAIPDIETRADVSERRRRKTLLVGGSIGITLAVLAAVHFLWMPLPDLFSMDAESEQLSEAVTEIAPEQPFESNQ
jgi:uncharacterized protein involved in exopolysaccharide biosynthesis